MIKVLNGVVVYAPFAMEGAEADAPMEAMPCLKWGFCR